MTKKETTKTENTENEPVDTSAENTEGESIDQGQTLQEDPPEEPEIVVGITLDGYDQLQKELEEARAQAQENTDRWQRARADYSNLKRRVELERNEMYHRAVGEVVKSFLDVLDDLELALKNRPGEEPGEAWAEGIELVYRKLLGKLEVQGLKVMETEGQFFDPYYHEAITQEESDEHESEQIIDVLRPGYMIGERVLRPAVVRIAV